MDPQPSPALRRQMLALGASIGWMVLVQLACLGLWQLGLLSRQAGLVHWLLLGVLPPALALWTSDSTETG